MAEQSNWWSNDPVMPDAAGDGDKFWQNDPPADAGPDLQSALDEIKDLVAKGIDRDQADALSWQRYGVGLQDLINYETDNSPVSVFGLEVPRGPLAAVIGHAQSLGSEWTDEGYGLAAKGAAYLMGEDPQAAYDRAVEEKRRLAASLQRTNPGSYFTGQVTGGINQAVVAPGATGSRYVAAAPSLLNLAGRSALVGSGQGLLAGAGAANGDLSDRLLGGGLGMATGAAGGFAFPIFTKGLQQGARYATGKVRDALNPAEMIPGILAAADGAPLPGGAGQVPNDIPVKPSEMDAAMRRIAQQMTRDGIPDNVTPQQIAGQLDDIGRPAALGDLGPNLQAEVQTAASRPGPGRPIVENNLNARQLGAVDPATGLRPEVGGQAQRVMDSARLGLGASGDEVAAALAMKRAERAATAQQTYGAAESSFKPFNLDDLVESLDERIAQSKGSIKATLQKARALIDDTTATTYHGMHQTKIALDDLIDSIGKDSSAGNVSRAALVDLKRRFLETVTDEGANPLYGDAIRQYAGDSAAMDALKLGTKAIGLAGKSFDAIKAELATMGPSEREFFREGLMQGIRDTALNTSRTAGVARKLEDIPSKLMLLREAFDTQAEFDAFRKSLQGESRMFDTFNKATRNSATQQRLANEADQADYIGNAADAAIAAKDALQGNIAGPLSRIGDWFRNQGFSENTNAQIARILTDPQASRDPALLQGILGLARRDNQMRGILGIAAPVAGKAAAPWTTGLLGLGNQ